MKVENEIDKILKKLLMSRQLEVELGDSTISMQVVDDGVKLLLSSQVYNGGNFIPLSVRHCVQNSKYKNRYALPTYLLVDEKKFQISLNYIGLTENLKAENFINLLNEFTRQADEWRHYLDENDRNDLVHIPVK